MKYLNNVIGESQVDVETLARELFILGDGDFKQLLHSVAIHSGLEKLEFMDQVSKSTIRQYDSLKEWRDEVGETT